MQIGNPELDRVCEQVIVPALKARGLDPKRVDRHNQGGLLKSEIVSFIENAEIIVADLTNERLQLTILKLAMQWAWTNIR